MCSWGYGFQPSVFLCTYTCFFVNKVWSNSGSVYNTVWYSKKRDKNSCKLKVMLWFHGKIETNSIRNENIYSTHADQHTQYWKSATCILCKYSLLQLHCHFGLLRLDKAGERPSELVLCNLCYYCSFSFKLWFHYSCIIFLIKVCTEIIQGHYKAISQNYLLSKEAWSRCSIRKSML